MREFRYLLAVPILIAFAAPAGAVPQYYKVLKRDYLDKLTDRKFAEAVDKADVRCLVCHQGKKEKKNRNVMGKELAKLLDHKKDAKNDEKITRAIGKVLAMKVDSKNEKSETYMDRLKASKWPGGNLEDLKKEPKGSGASAEKKE